MARDAEPGSLKPPGAEDFDDVLDDLGGLGKYQKRLLFFLLGPLFFIMPFPLLHQVLLNDMSSVLVMSKMMTSPPCRCLCCTPPSMLATLRECPQPGS